MKRIIIIGSLVSCALLALTGEVQAQSGIEQVLKNIEANNKELQANAQLITSQKLEAKTDNNLPDPTLSYAHLWGAKDKNETIGELVVSQSFDFPSLYATRNKLNRLKAGAFDSQADVFRQEKLLLAKESVSGHYHAAPAKTHLGGTAAQRRRTCQNVRQAPPNRRCERSRNE